MGLWSHRHRCLAAAASAHGSICLAAGAMQYSVGKFLVALTAGRIVRYSLLAFLAAHYGRQMLTTVMSRLGHPVLIAIIGLIAAAIGAFIFILLKKRNMTAHT